MSNLKIKPEEKSARMADIGTSFAVIEAARKDVEKLETELAPQIKAIVTSFGPGPHRMAVPTGNVKDGVPETVDYFVSFRKSGDTYAISAARADSIT